MDNRPIGVFDSGLGGLTGVRELRKRLPHEEIIYFGDTGRVPYGSRSPETILQYARQDVAFLLSKNVKCIMAACGTVSSTYPAAEAAQLPVPYLGVVDAAAREAAFATRNRRIGVIGTAATIRSRSYEKLLRSWCRGWRSPPAPARCSYRWWRPGMWITARRKAAGHEAGDRPVPHRGAGRRGGHPDSGLHPLPAAQDHDRGVHGPVRHAGGPGQDRSPPSGADARRSAACARRRKTKARHIFTSAMCRTALCRRQTCSWASTRAARWSRSPLTNIDKG